MSVQRILVGVLLTFALAMSCAKGSSLDSGDEATGGETTAANGTGGGGGGSSTGTGGLGGGAVNACEGVSCNMPPANACADATNLTVHEPNGTCNQGQCEYASSLVPCPNGCTGGACDGDPCIGVSCVSPPANSCADATHLLVYESPGVCNAGSCEYGSHQELCASGCSGGACNGGCSLPTDACTTGTQDRKGCTNARVIGRAVAGTPAGYTASPTNCTSSNLMDSASCSDSGNDHTYRLFLRQGETMTVTLSTGAECLGSTWYATLKFYTNAGCTSTQCSTTVLCDQDKSNTTKTHVAAQDGWYIVVVDGSSGNAGVYTVNVKLTCNAGNCEC